VGFVPILGQNAKIQQASFLTGLGGQPRVLGDFNTYFDTTFSSEINIVRTSPKSEAELASQLPLYLQPATKQNLFSLVVKNKSNSIEFFGNAFGKGISFKKAADMPAFDNAIRKLVETAMVYHTKRNPEWQKEHDINREGAHIKNKRPYGKSTEDMGRPFYEHIATAKRAPVLKEIDEDIQGHIKEHGFGPSGWLPDRANEFLEKYQRNKSIRNAQSAYLGTTFQSLLRGIPDKHMMDFVLDFMEGVDPKGYQNVISLNQQSGAPTSYAGSIITNTHSPERREQMVRSYYGRICS
jgi:hypothetical protein